MINSHYYYRPHILFYTESCEKMRIISGSYKGRELDGSNLKGTRPTMDRVKESLFGMIQNEIKNCICLDLFAGSGSLGLEALSNGATICYFVDHNFDAIRTIQRNKTKLSVKEETIFLQQDYKQALQYFYQNKVTFDLIFLDPPYQENLIQDCLDKIRQYDLLKDDGLIICEYETEVFVSTYTCVKEKKYGKKRIRIYTKEKRIEEY